MATSVYHISVGGKYPEVLSNLRKAVPDIHLSNFCHPRTIEHCETMAILSLCTKKNPTVSILILSFLNRAS